MQTYEFITKFPEVKLNEPLGKYVQNKVGGPAELLYIAKDRPTLERLVMEAKTESIPVTVLGWASNTLISDKGIKGLVVLNRSNNIVIHDKEEGDKHIELEEREEETLARLDQLDKEIYGDFAKLDYDESNLPISKVYMDSGVSLPLAIYKTIQADLTGLQWYSGIPGTIGGAIYNNIHGGTHYISEVLESIDVIDRETLKIKTLSTEEIKPDYDYTNLQENKYFILGATFNLYHGDSEKALKVMHEWRRQKKIQPQISTGCMWKNISNEDKTRLNIPSTSMGYIVDKLLDLKGKVLGEAKISDKHAAFIENTGHAKASDILKLMKEVYNSAKVKLGIEAKPEIFFAGFDDDEIKEFK